MRSTLRVVQHVHVVVELLGRRAPRERARAGVGVAPLVVAGRAQLEQRAQLAAPRRRERQAAGLAVAVDLAEARERVAPRVAVGLQRGERGPRGRHEPRELRVLLLERRELRALHAPLGRLALQLRLGRMPRARQLLELGGRELALLATRGGHRDARRGVQRRRLAQRRGRQQRHEQHHHEPRPSHCSDDDADEGNAKMGHYSVGYTEPDLYYKFNYRICSG